MVTASTARQMALSLPGVEEKSHFEKPGFRVRNRIFSVLHLNNSTMVVKLSLIDQSVFCKFDAGVIYPVQGAWGRRGWTVVHLKMIQKRMFTDILQAAWQSIHAGKTGKL